MSQWIAVLWLSQLATHWTPRLLRLTDWPDRIAREAFYIMQGAQSMLLLLTLALLIGRPRLTPRQSFFVFALAVYGAAEQGLIAICGVGYYFLTPPDVRVNTAMSLCDRGSAWWWMPLFAAFLTLAFVRLRRED